MEATSDHYYSGSRRVLRYAGVLTVPHQSTVPIRPGQPTREHPQILPGPHVLQQLAFHRPEGTSPNVFGLQPKYGICP